MSGKHKKHPCFDNNAASCFARIHLPLVQKCNIQCNYCNRKYSCPNENRPGVTSKILMVEDVYNTVQQAVNKYSGLNIIGVAGPGEPLAEPDKLYNALKNVKQDFPNLQLCLSTNGFALMESIDWIKELKVDFITVTINTLKIETAKKIYRLVDVEELLRRQIEGIKTLKNIDITTKINTVVIPGINYDKENDEIVDIARLAKDNNVFAQNLMPFYPVDGSVFEKIRSPEKEEIDFLRKKCEKFVKQLSHCKRCRADAEGYL